MHTTQFKYAFLFAILTVALIALMTPWQNNENTARLELIAQLGGEWVGRSAPDFVLPDLKGQKHRLTDYRGKVVFLNFWGSFCAPCREEMPSMERLVRQYKERGLVMIAISFDPDLADAQNFMQQFLPGRESAMTVLHDPSSQSGQQFGTDLLPETYIIDQEGRTVVRFVNTYDWGRPEVKNLIENLLTDSKSTKSLF